ncbi:MAG: ATP-dependent DNA helicase RecG, partial [Firmicutes bacterium]|nr:ATP-dependent DNA helicase RecG [Bacillota bacterium]
MASKDKALDLNSDITELKGFGPKKAELLKKLGLFRLRDMLYYYPRGYEDRRNVKEISALNNEDRALVKAKVLLVSPGRGFGRKRTLRLLTEDDSGRMEVLFFSAGYMLKAFRQGQEYYFLGKVKNENGRITMFHPAFFSSEEGFEGGIQPLYSLCRGISQKDLRKLSKGALSVSGGLSETLPDSVIEKARLCSLPYALSNIHYPEDEARYSEARYRLIYEELFDLKMAVLLSGDRFGSGRQGQSVKSSGAKHFVSRLPYELTGAQKRCLKAVLEDMASETAMNRLVQGDVGSGKTAVAEAALCQAAEAGFQGAFMAPTELLAQQHFETLSRDLMPLGITVDFISGSLSAKERRSALDRLRTGETQVAVGTHALISAGVEFFRLGLVITDEQHRFGVNQRKSLAGKGENPDVLVMTATPIPRTLALVLYGDLDVSVIDEMPPGRRQIITEKFTEEQRMQAYKKLIAEVRKGRQAYIVAPFIEDSEAIDGHSAESLYDDFCSAHKDISCGLVHGAMDQREKDDVMASFYRGEISVLISTVVIEVGINVPNASVMLIENSERFGLAQLHQLRGRVGRGEYQSYCYLVLGEDPGEVAEERAEILCSTNDGFVIADKDLEMRGPGEMLGYRQHGLPQLVLADLSKHIKVAQKAGEDAQQLIEADPG